MNSPYHATGMMPGTGPPDSRHNVGAPNVKDDKKLQLIARVPIFARLRGRDLERVGQLVEEIDVPAGKVLMRQGETGHEFFLIVDGRVRVERDGRVLKNRSAGEFVGEIALIDEGPRSATVTCETPCRLLVLGHREFHTLLGEHPDLQLLVLKTLAERVRHLEPEPID